MTLEKTHYVNGKELYAELCVYHEAYKISLINGDERPPVTEKMASAIIRIANKLSKSWNFVNYSYRDELVQDGILKCLEKIHLFDPLKSENVFAYATQTIYNEFLNRIKKEQKESSVKARMIREKMSSEFVEHGVDSDNDDGSNGFVEFLKENDCLIDYFELKKDKEKEVHPSLKHRNKTPYKTKAVVEKELPAFDLSSFEVS